MILEVVTTIKIINFALNRILEYVKSDEYVYSINAEVRYTMFILRELKVEILVE